MTTNTNEKKSSIETNGVVPIPKKASPSGFGSSIGPNGEANFAKSVGPRKDSGIAVGTGSSVRVPPSAAPVKVEEQKQVANPQGEKPRRSPNKPVAAQPIKPDKYGRTPKQKRREDFIVSSIATIVFLGVVFGGLYFGYDMAMDILK